MILNGHIACNTNALFRQFFRVTGARPSEASNRAFVRSLTTHVWTFDDAREEIAGIFENHFRPLGLTFQFFVCPLLVDQWELGHTDYVRRQLQIPTATLLSWDRIGRLVEAGNVIGSHGIDHNPFSAMSRDQAAEQLERSREMIQIRVGRTPTSFAFPYGSVGVFSVEAGVFARTWYRDVYLSDNSLAIAELADGVFNRRHGEFGLCVSRGLLVGALNIMLGVKKWRS